jgi:hypothetical protein
LGAIRELPLGRLVDSNQGTNRAPHRFGATHFQCASGSVARGIADFDLVRLRAATNPQLTNVAVNCSHADTPGPLEQSSFVEDFLNTQQLFS